MKSNFESLSEEYFFNLKKNSLINKAFCKSLENSFFSGGKRARPQLLYAMGRALGAKERRLFPAAFAVELVHTYSLIHDDLPSMDDDIYRRGKVTHHIRYGEASAVLAGDALLTLAFQVLAESYRGEVLRRLLLSLSVSSGCHGMVGGQALDCLTERRDVEIFKKIHYLKTAKLFEYSCQAAAVIQESSEETIGLSKKIGRDIGLLFQMQDDLFDEDEIVLNPEENILSVLKKSDVVSQIQKIRDQVECSIDSISLVDKSLLKDFLVKIFKRKS